MYKSFKIQNFRCFQELELNDLALVNLIIGMNNVGKTALLEAIFLHGGAYNPELTLQLNAFRGIEMLRISFGRWNEYPLSSIFYQFDVSKTIELSSEDTIIGYRTVRLKTVGESGERSEVNEAAGASVLDESTLRYEKDEPEGIFSTSEVAKILELEYKSATKQGTCRMIINRKGIRVEPLPTVPPFETFFQGARMRIPLEEQARRYGNLEVNRKQESVLAFLRLIEPRLKDIRSVTTGSGQILHGDTGTGHLMPLPLMGEGIVRLADLATSIGNAPDGVVLIDEIENGLHYSVMPKVWKAVAIAARQSKTQIFATTHSWECIRAAHEAFASDESYDFRLHRLGWLNGEIKAVTYDQETLAAAIKAELEVR